MGFKKIWSYMGVSTLRQRERNNIPTVLHRGDIKPFAYGGTAGPTPPPQNEFVTGEKVLSSTGETVVSYAPALSQNSIPTLQPVYGSDKVEFTLTVKAGYSNTSFIVVATWLDGNLYKNPNGDAKFGFQAKK